VNIFVDKDMPTCIHGSSSRFIYLYGHVNKT